MKDSQKLALIAFNLVCMIWCFYKVFTVDNWTLGAFFGTAFLAILFGAIVGGIVYFFASKND